MRRALAEADLAAVGGDEHEPDVPVGCVVLDRDGTVIATGHNRREADHDPTAHAETVAIRAAGRALGSWRLDGCTLVVTLEPCAMCAGAIVLARLARLVYGAADPKAGACGSVLDVTGERRLNHRVAVTSGVLEADCGELLREFFRRKRKAALRLAEDPGPLAED